MLKSARITNRFIRGMIKAVPIAVGYFPLSVSFGVIAAQTGLSLFHTALMSVVVYAGAAQFMAVNMILLGTVGVEIIIATLVLNLRHFVMSISFLSRFNDVSRWWQTGFALGLTDETFAMLSLSQETAHERHTVAGLMFTAYSVWVIGTIVGWLFSLVIPSSLGESMSIALYAMFIGLLVPAIKNDWTVGLIAGLAAFFSSIFYYWIGGGWGVVLATVVAALAGIVIMEED